VRVALCVRHNRKIYRLVCFNESKSGFFCVLMGGAEDFHSSYHEDGRRHNKLGKKRFNKFKDIPIALHKNYKHLMNCNLPLTKNWFNEQSLYNGDHKTESIILLDQSVLYNKDTLWLDIWMTDRASEQKTLDIIAEFVIKRSGAQVIAEHVYALDYFPEQKIVLTLCVGNSRSVDSSDLMFPENR
jgi:hypothetical protein